MKERYIAGIDGLRAIAVFSVVLYHAGFSEWFPGGYVGVDIFFVISGFLITRLIKAEFESTGTFSFSNFYYRRCKRLFPALYFTLLASFVFAFLLFTPQHLERFGGELIYSSMSLSNFYFWNESGYFNTESDFKPLLHTWSLSVEEQFYLFWPIALIFLVKNYSKAIQLVVISLTVLISLAANLIMSDGQSTILSTLFPNAAEWFSDGPATIFYLAPFRIFEFGLGAILCWLPKRTNDSNLTSEVFLFSGLSLIAYSLTTFNDATVFPSYNALIPSIGTVLIIWSVNARYLGLILRNRLFVACGLISYSLYLCHWPIIVFYKYYTMTPLSLIEQVVLSILSVVIGFLMYRFIEQPFRKHSPSKNRTSRSGFGLTAALMLMVLILPAATLWANSGWPWRVDELPKDIAEQLNNSKQFHVDNYGGQGYPETGWISHESTKSEADLVLLGDSHVRHLSYGLDQLIGKVEKKNIAIHSISCLLLPETSRTTPGVDWDALCPKTVDSAISTINTSLKAALIISNFWAYQIPVSKDITNGKANKNYEDILPKISKLKILIGNHPLILVGNVPGAGVNDAIGCFSRPSYLPVNCDKILSQNEDQIGINTGNSILQSYASKNEGIFYLEPKEALCTNGSCFAFSNGKALYSDKSHLSKEGSYFFASYFSNQILKIIDGSFNQVKHTN